jgi:hypothetical protein
MAEENKSQNVPVDNPTPIDPANPPEPIKEMQAKTIREIRAEQAAVQEFPDEAQALREAESPEVTAARSEFEKALDKGIEAVEDAANALDRATTPRTPADALAHAVPNTTWVPFIGKVSLPIYDVVYISLAIFTAIEIVLGELPHGPILIITLLAITFVKAFHVVWFYMHLKSDDRIFWYTLLIPFFIAGLGLLYLLAVPPGGY